MENSGQRFTSKIMSKVFGYECFGKSNLCYLHAVNGQAVECKVCKLCHKEFHRKIREMKRMETEEIINATSREKMVFKRLGGDFWIQIQDQKGNIITDFVMEMNSNSQRTYSKILGHFKEIKKCLKNQ